MKKTDEKIVKTFFSFKLILIIATFLIIVPQISLSEDTHQGEEEEEAFQNRLELFLGNTHEDGEDGFTVGLFYEYRLSKLFGIGLGAEHVAGDLDFWAVGVPFYFHPYLGFRFILAPGIERKHGENLFFFRVGAGYEFEIGRWSVSPEVNVDWADDGETALVYGFNVGYGF